LNPSSLSFSAVRSRISPAVIFASGPLARSCEANGPVGWKPQNGWCSSSPSTPSAARDSPGPGLVDALGGADEAGRHRRRVVRLVAGPRAGRRDADLRVDVRQPGGEARHSADPVHLVRVFGITESTAIYYVHAAHPERRSVIPRQ
jgi:hypothetical protein